MTFGLNELYTAIRNTIRNTDVTGLSRCQAIQTFSVIDEYQAANREQIEKTVIEKYKPFFYSRKWERDGYPSGKLSFEYPLLVIIPQSERYTGIVGASDCLHEMRLHLALLDYMNEQCATISMNQSYLDNNGNCCPSCLDSRYTCDSRNQFEIEADTSALLLNFIRQLSTVVYYDNPACSCGLFLTDDYAQTLPDIYTQNPVETALLKNYVWPNAFKDITIETYAGGMNRLHGAVINNLTIVI